MKTREEIISAIEARIKQLQDGIEALRSFNGTLISRVTMESAQEELQTLLDWST